MSPLLDLEVYVFLLTWWPTQQVTALARLSMLDMAYDAFDDQYEGCVEEMEKKAPQLLKEEMTMNQELKYEWEEAEKKWKGEIKKRISHPRGFSDSHGIALVAYTGALATDFNRATREFRQNPHNFHYKAFHYYLTRALQLLSNQNCHTVFRGSKTKFNYSGTGSVRFGQFASSSLEKKVACSEPFRGDSGTLFVIKTCLGVYIKEFSYYHDEEEVLIPGYEVYHKVIKSTDKSCIKIHLEDPQRMKSNFNCFYANSGTQEGPASLLLLLLGLRVLLCLPAELWSFPAWSL